MLFSGSATALVTPFTENGINYESLKALIEMQISGGSDAIVVCGTTGESATMSEKEQKAVIEFSIKAANKRIPIIAGTGSNDTKKAIKMSQFAQSVGADGLLLVTPYYNKTTDRGLIAHFTAIAESVSLPIILYNVPHRTGLNMLPKVVLELSHVKNIAGIKEASGNLNQLYDIAKDCSEEFMVYTGNDEQVLPALALGANGIISVVSNIVPKQMHEIYEAFVNHDVALALKIYKEISDLTNAMSLETNPIPVKTALNIMGLNAGVLRLPLVPMQDKNLQILTEKMQKFIK